jgi:hypothetical protein
VVFWGIWSSGIGFNHEIVLLFGDATPALIAAFVAYF